MIGDAAHATTPNLGQGACQALEDAVVLAAELGKNKQRDATLANFEKRRLARTRTIVKRLTMIGQFAQLQNPLLIALRNTLVKLTPKRVNEKQLEYISKVDF